MPLLGSFLQPHKTARRMLSRNSHAALANLLRLGFLGALLAAGDTVEVTQQIMATQKGEETQRGVR